MTDVLNPQTESRAQPLAILPNGSEIGCTFEGDGFHGTYLFAPEDVKANGIPAKGDDRRLYEHALGNSTSAFRGTTVFPLISAAGQGAVYWAGEGGWVYEVENLPMWALEEELQGRVPALGGFTGCPNVGELEQATPARIEHHRIVRVFEVTLGRVRHGQEILLAKPWKPSSRP